MCYILSRETWRNLCKFCLVLLFFPELPLEKGLFYADSDLLVLNCIKYNCCLLVFLLFFLPAMKGCLSPVHNLYLYLTDINIFFPNLVEISSSRTLEQYELGAGVMQRERALHRYAWIDGTAEAFFGQK